LITFIQTTDNYIVLSQVFSYPCW